MGFFDKEVDGSIDRMFDFNRDGVLDPMEQSMQLDFEMRLLDDDFDSDGDSEYDDNLADALEDAGIDRDEWRMMDDDERAEALEDAGLDPDDFDEY